MRIRTYLVLMAAAILLPVVLAAGMALGKIREGERDAAQRALRETARATSLIVDREAQGALLALKALGGSPHLERRDFKAFYAQAAALDRQPDVWTLLLDETGTQVLNTVVPFGTAPPPPVAAERVAQVIATQKPLITDLLKGPVTGKMLTTIYVPAAAAGGRKYVVAQAFSVDHWKNTALQAQMPADWIVGVLDRKGRFIARSHRTAELLGQPAAPELVAAAAASNDGLIRHATVEGIEAYDAFTHSSLTGWTVAVAAPVASVEAAAQRALQVAVAGMVLAVGAAILAAAAFGQRFIRAVANACQAAVALGKGQKPEPHASAIAELSALHRALADAGGLLDAERKSRHTAEAERERLLKSETAAREAAQAQNVAKDQFLAMLGHELRNPLAAISGATSLLEMGGIEKGRAERYFEIIRRQNRHLGHIVNDLLDVSRLMAGKITLEATPLNLAECVTNCVQALQATDRAIGYRITVRADSVWVQGDAVRVEQILNNLITNALKFSPVGTDIRVEVHKDTDHAVVTVQDWGTGIAAGLLPHVFEPFMQGPAPSHRTQSGLGIGLALVKQLVSLHGGIVHATSAGPGMGSTFTFWLPAIAVPRAELAAPVAPVATARKLVFVEDNADARDTMAELLRAQGYEVVEVADGEGALPAVLAARPDVVILDIGLPDIDGYEVARRLREHPQSRAIPLVALTGYGQLRQTEGEALAGFDAHLVKPVQAAELAQAIEQALAKAAEVEG